MNNFLQDQLNIDTKQQEREILNRIKIVMDRDFSEEQEHIITHHGYPLNAVAGAGSGKTTVSIGKILYLMLAKNVDPQNILSITFSKKASKEIEDRYMVAKNRLEGTYGTPVFKTFHAFFLSIIRQTPEFNNLVICNYTDYSRELYKEMEDRKNENKSDMLKKYMNLKSVLMNFNVSEYGVLPEEWESIKEDLPVSYYKEYVKVVAKYKEIKTLQGRLDFDDMQNVLLEKLRHSPQSESLINSFREQYKYLILDEYQDISPVQVEIIDILMGEEQRNNLVATGDDDQCQPAGTEILLSDNTLKKIEDVRTGDMVKGYDLTEGIFKPVRVNNTAKRLAVNYLTVHTKRKSSSYTHDHITYGYVRSLSSNDTYNLVYKKDGKYFSDRQPISFIWNNKIKEFWVLEDVVEKKELGFLECQKLLADNNYPIKYPLSDDLFKQNIVEIRATHLQSGLFDILIMENEELYAESIVGIEKKEEQTTVYSLDVDDTKNYVADGVLTHNCIYSFRGSDSQHIIRFLEKYRNARRKMISKNYRCHSNILNEVIPMISRNQERVSKNLESANEGGQVTYLDIDDKDDFTELKRMMKEDMQSGKNMSSEVAILVRYNRTRTLLADALAEEGIPIDIGSRNYLLQKNRIYVSAMELIQSIKHNDKNLFRKYAMQILGRSFIGRRDDVDRFINYTDDFVNELGHSKLGVPEEIRKMIVEIRDSDNAFVVMNRAILLFKERFRWLISARFMSASEYEQVVTHINKLTLNDRYEATISWESFLYAEQYKKSMLVDFIGNKNVLKIHTIHSVKGLEFDKVYVYGVDSDAVSMDDYLKYYSDHEDSKLSAFASDKVYNVENVVKNLTYNGGDVEEERRVFYVACTRAINELVICYRSHQVTELEIDYDDNKYEGINRGVRLEFLGEHHPFPLLFEMKSFRDHFKFKEPYEVVMAERYRKEIEQRQQQTLDKNEKMKESFVSELDKRVVSQDSSDLEITPRKPRINTALTGKPFEEEPLDFNKSNQSPKIVELLANSRNSMNRANKFINKK